MIAVNIILMVVVLIMLAGLLAWSIRSDRNSKRAVAPEDKPLHHNLMLPRHLRGGRVGNLSRKDRSRSAGA